jgi:hypothetical protein
MPTELGHDRFDISPMPTDGSPYDDDPKEAVYLVVNGLPAHKTRRVKDYVASTKGRLSLHFLAAYAPGPLLRNELFASNR